MSRVMQRKAQPGTSATPGRPASAPRPHVPRPPWTPPQGPGAATSPRANQTGLPDRLKAGVEALSGLSMDGVRVHRNSSEPAKLDALAFARGTDIHLGPGQEEHLPHEAWHVVQQKQGRVRATRQMKGFGLNEDSGLEAEADRMAASLQAGAAAAVGVAEAAGAPEGSILQLQTPKGAKKTKDTKKVAAKRPKTTKAKPSYLSYDEIKTLVSANNKSGQSDELIIAQIWKETKFDPNQKTGSHHGLLQIYPGALTDVNKNYGTSYKQSEMLTPATNIAAGTLYLKLRIKWAKGSVSDGLNGYGTGAGYSTSILAAEKALQDNPEDPIAELSRIISPQ